ncbi:MAG: TIGR00730 family Rossman fold protein [Prevotella sp.]|nr:TIGR00730 family Rossman fold protein [Prevotella sp.]
MKICVFCSANDQIEAAYFQKTEALGRWCAANGHDLVFGGHDSGLMHAVSRACKDAGGRIIGVVPRKIEQMGRLTPFLDVHIPCEDLTDRKQLMMDMSDAFIVLPGGIGTLDELFTVGSCATLAYHAKTIIVYDIDGFWAPLASLLDHLEHERMMRRPWRSFIHVATTLDEIADIIH